MVVSKYENIYELSPLQSGLLFQALYQPQSEAYFVQHIFELDNINAQYWYKIWHIVINRCDALRANFVWEKVSKPLQRIQREVDLPWIEEDWTQDANLKEKLQYLIQSEREKRFDLNKSLLMRFNLIKIDKDKYYFIWNIHHLLIDGWSIPLIIEDVIAGYRSLECNEAIALKTRRPYKHYISWLLEQSQSKAIEYWKQNLLDVMPTILGEQPIAAGDGCGEIVITFNEMETKQLNDYAKALETTTNTVLQSLWAIVLSKYKKQEDLVFGVTVSGRNIDLHDVASMVGLFINTLPIRIQIKPAETIRDFLKRVQAQMMEAQCYGYLPLSTIQSLSGERTLFDCIYVFENYPTNTEIVHAGNNKKLRVKPIQIVEKTEYKLSIAVIPQKELEIRLNYEKNYFSTQYIQTISKHLRQLIVNTIQSEDQFVGNCSLLSKDEEDQFCKRNGIQSNYNQNTCIHYIFESIAENNQSKAILYEGKYLSYRELNERANQLAHYLIKHEVGSGSIVGIACGRTLETIVGILGVLKSGGAYVPIDPSYPSNRIQFILTDTNVSFIIARRTLLEKVQISEVKTIFLDELTDELTRYSTLNPIHKTLPSELAYVIYTSGSTGQPKGVMIEHRSLCNLASYQANYLRIDATSRILQFASSSFDSSVWEWVGALCHGASLHLFPYDELPAGEILHKILQDEQITIATLPPSVLETLPYEIDSLRTLVVAGEVCSKRILDIWRQRCYLIHGYGLTETTVCATLFALHDGAYVSSVIGKPVPNTQLYILDAFLNRVPIGVSGEIYIGGAGLARGYLDRPPLTAERFLPNPFVKDINIQGSRLYKTGDWGRYLEDENIEFLGRIDNQVKLRGFRIELGEIESVLRCIDGVTQTVALVREDIEQQKRLVVYLVLESSHERTTEKQSENWNTHIINQCRELCQSRLPDYMRPSHIIILDYLPLTLTGKIDKNALPKPEERMGIDQFEEPEGELEQQLAEIWKKLLKLSKVGRNDNFFSLGGDSIISIQMVSQARQKGLIFSVKQVFDARTIAKLILTTTQLSVSAQATQTAVTGTTAPLLPIQRWFFEKADNIHHFNQAHWFVVKKVEIEGACTIDVTRLKNAIGELCEYHDAFRLKYKQKDGYWEQYYSDHTGISFEVIKESSWTEETLEIICSEIQSGLDIERGPLSRVVWFEGKGLFWVIHHLIVDGVSWRILIEDLNTLYEGHSLGLKGHGYKTWGSYLQGYNHLESTKAYYSNKPKTGLCLEAGSQRTRHKINFSAETSKSFIQKAHKAYNTQANDLLLTALVQAIGAYSNYQLCIDMEGHGREMLGSDLDLTRTVGWFTTVFPVYLTLSEPMNLDTSIKEIKEQLRQVPEKGITYGLASYIQKQIPEILSANISFNYLGQWDTADASGHTFKLGNEGVGCCLKDNNRLFHDLDILGQVKDGVLSFEWESNYGASLIRELVNNFKQRLEALILHCSTEGVYGYTPSDFDLIKLPQHQLNHIVHIQLDDIYPLSPIQSGLLFQKLYDLESDAYFIQSIFELNNLNVCKWRAAWNAVVNRHDSLKAGFFWVGLDEPVQLIHKKVELLWAEEHWIQKDDTDLPIEEKLQKLLYDERRKGFDVSKAPLMRFNLIQIENNKYYFVWNMHHLLTDGWSGSIILNDVIDIYNNNHGVHSNTRKPFKGYMSWLLKQDQVSAQRYWESYLSGVTPTVLEGDASLIEDEIYRDYTLVLDAEETNKLNQYAKSIEVTTNTILQGVWGILLSKYTRHDDVVFGMVVSGRSIALPGIEDMVGVFINTLPTRIKLKPSDTIKKFMQLLQVQMSATQEHGYISLSSIQSMQNERTLFDTIFAFENYPISYENQDDLSIRLINVIEKTEYKLSIAVVPTNEIEIKINYNTRYFTENYINKLSKHLYYLLLNIVQNTYQFIGNVSLIDSNELTQRGQWNNTVANYPSTKSVHELFEDISAVNKDEIAVIYKDTQWTYEVLNQTANQLAHYLRKNQVTTETLVGICAPRGFDLITGFLAILKSGGVYLPLDPEYPIDRLEYMLEDTGVKILLTTVNLKDKFKGFKGKIIFFDHREYGDESIDNLNTKVLPDNLAYVIYTSGSTGKSKGVAIKHRSLINNILWHANELNITNARVLQRASSSFDASIWEMVLPLINAHSLIIFPENGEMQSDDLNDFIEKYRCNVVQMTPSLTEIFRLKNNTCIEKLVVGGEALTLDHVSIIKNNLPNASLYNVYGATESCIDASYCLVGGNKGVVTVGKPLCNMQIHILDQHLNPVPIGCIGEIYIGGIGLARGYLNRPGLTAEKFLPNPFINMEETRIYKTGDLGRYFEDGDIEYLGRIDHQVKIRGFRVELGEIESIIQSIAEIEQCIVTMREEKKGQQILVAYIILDRTQNFVNEVQKIEIINKCREICKAKLPDHMQPNHIMLLEKIPLTPNEKVDRNALPKPGNREDLSQYEPPSNEQEQLICEAFGKVLKLEKIGVHDDFFLLGGNSILAIYLVVALQANFNIQIKDIFEHRTPRTLALFSRLDKCALINNLERIKLLYKTVIGDNHASEKWAQVKENTYLESIENLQNDSFYNLRKPILNVLLTGATGFLGCNLLNQLLNLTDYRIFLLVRADSQHDAMARVNNKFQFYFNKTLDANYLSRVVVINADIEKEKFGLIQDQYDILVNQIDSVIHAAALVKHYGEWDAFYASNVQATINLLELTRLTKHRDFHYISTCSVLNNGFISNSEGYIYTEDDLPKDLNVTDNVYVQTKLLGEREVVRYRDFNLKTTIYRVGNLAFMSENSRTQENIKDNAFSSWIKYFLHEKISTNNMEKMEISPVDHTACAIIKLFDKKNLDNATYHLFNPHLCDVSEAFNQCKTIKFSNVSMEHFIDNIIQGLNNNSDCDLIVKFLLHQGWLDDRCFKASSPTKVLQEKTNSILKRLQFDWLPIKQESFDEYLKQLVTHR